MRDAGEGPGPARSASAADGVRPMAVVERPFAQLIHEHGAVLTRVARRLCGNQSDADDLVHDTYERALRSWDRDAGGCNPRSWLITILHHLFIDRCRQKRHRPKIETLDDLDVIMPEPGDPPVWESITPCQLELALATIGAEFRRAYELRMTGRSYDEIAAELQIAKGTVGTRLNRARRSLRDALLRQLETLPLTRGGATATA